MSNNIWFPFYVQDWLSSNNVILMTPAEEGAYIHLLAIEWNTEDCSLPINDNELAIMSRLNQDWFNGSGDKIKKNFIERDGKFFNKRLCIEKEKYTKISEKRAKAGKKGMAERWDNKGKHNKCYDFVITKGITKHNQVQSQSQSQSDTDIKKEDLKEYMSVLNLLNTTTKKNFKPVPANLKLISARFKEGRTIADFKQVIELKTSQWLNDPKMNKYLRPETLFNATKFEGYLNESNPPPIYERKLGED